MLLFFWWSDNIIVAIDNGKAIVDRCFISLSFIIYRVSIILLRHPQYGTKVLSHHCGLVLGREGSPGHGKLIDSFPRRKLYPLVIKRGD